MDNLQRLESLRPKVFHAQFETIEMLLIA